MPHQSGRHGKDADPDHEKSPPAKLVAGCAADQEKRRQAERVGIDQPLNHDGGGRKVGLDGRRSDIDDGFVDIVIDDASTAASRTQGLAPAETVRRRG